MKKIINILILSTIILQSILPTSVLAYQQKNHDIDQSYVVAEKRLVTDITYNSQVGDYVKGDTETIRMYYDKCGYRNPLPCVGSAFYTVYDLNTYENREIVVSALKTEKIEVGRWIDATYKKEPIVKKEASYGKPFEINYFQITYYFLRGYDIVFDKKVETKKVFDFSKFRLVEKKVTVDFYQARKITYKEVVVGYKTVIDKPAHYGKRIESIVIPPKTVKYKAYITNVSYGVSGFFNGLGEGAKGTLDFGGQLISFVTTGDETKITFIRNGQKYLASVIDKTTDATEFYKIMITDAYKNTTFTIKILLKHYAENPDQISNLLGTIAYAVSISGLGDAAIAKLNFNITDDVVRLSQSFPSSIGSVMVNYGDDISQLVAKYGDNVMGAIDDYDSNVIKSVMDNLDDFDNVDDLITKLDQVKDATSKVDAPTFKSSQQVPVDPDTGQTRSTLKLGRDLHKEYKINDIIDGVKAKEFVIPGTRKRVDFIDMENGIVYELKPNNSKAIALGKIQAQGYVDELIKLGKTNKAFDKSWTYIIDTY